MADDLGSNGNASQFSEVLSVEIDLNKFATSLKSLEQAWDGLVSRISQKAGIGAGFEKSTDKLRQSAEKAETQYYKVIRAQDEEKRAFQAAEAAKSAVATAQNTLRTRVEQGASTAKIKAAQAVLDAARRLEQLRTAIVEQQAKVRTAIEANENRQLIANFKATARQLQTEASKANSALNSALKGQAKVDAAGAGGYFGQLSKEILGSKMMMGAQLYAGVLAAEGAIAALLAPVRIFTGLLKDGWHHIDEMQLAAEQLQGSLLESTTFSADINRNFELSAKAAKFAAEQFHEFEARAGVSSELLGKAFNALLVSGGGAGLKNVREAVELTESLAAAITKISGPNAGRALLGEIPKLLSGSLADGSKLLRIMGMTAEEARNLVKAGIEHRDLLQRLAPLFAPYLAVVETADSRMARLNTQLKVAKDSIAEAIARPLWEQWLSVLQRVKEFYDQHKDGLVEIGHQIGQLIGQFGTLGGVVLDSFGGIKNVLATLMGFVARMGVVIANASRLRESLKSFEEPAPNAQEEAAISRVNAAGTFFANEEDKKVAAQYENRVKQAHAAWIAERQATANRYEAQIAGFEDSLRVADNMATQSFDEFVAGLKREAQEKRDVQLVVLENQQRSISKQLAVQMAIDGSLANQSAKTKVLAGQYTEVLDKIRKIKEAS
jgi:hypothetical protein